MRKLILLILLSSSLIARAQTTPVAPIQLTTNSAYIETSTGIHWFFNGATYQWWADLGVRDSSKYITPYYAAHNFAPISGSTNYQPLENQRLSTTNSVLFNDIHSTANIVVGNQSTYYSQTNGGSAFYKDVAGNTVGAINNSQVRFTSNAYAWASSLYDGDTHGTITGDTWFVNHATYSGGRALGAFDFMYKQKADSLYAPVTGGLYKLKSDTINAQGYARNWQLTNALSNYVPLSRTITINGTSHDLTTNSTYTVTATASNTLTLGNGILGTSYNGSAPITASLDTSIAVTKTYAGRYQVLSSKGSANGYASLDGSAKILLSQIPDALLGAVNYQGNYNATTNLPALPTAASGNKGYYWVVSVAGTQFGLTLNAGDWIISNGSAYQKVDNNNAVTSVFGRVGAVVASSSDYNTYYGLLTNPLSQFASTTSAQLAGIISDKTGTAGSLVFSNAPTLVTPNIGAATGASLVTTGQIVASGRIVSSINTSSAVSQFINTSPTGQGLQIQGGSSQSVSAALSINDYANSTIASFYNDISIFATPLKASISAGAANNFVVSNLGLLQYRTAAQVLSDIGAAPSTGSISYLNLSGSNANQDISISQYALFGYSSSNVVTNRWNINKNPTFGNIQLLSDGISTSDYSSSVLFNVNGNSPKGLLYNPSFFGDTRLRWGVDNTTNNTIAYLNDLSVYGLLSNPLSQFASTTSAQLRTVLSDETGTGLAYFQGGDIGTPSAGVGTNLTGTAAGLSIGGTASNITAYTINQNLGTGNTPVFNGFRINGTSSSTYIDAVNANTLNYGYGDNSVIDGWVNYKGYNGGTTQYRNFKIGDGRGNVLLGFTGSTGAAAFTGNLSAVLPTYSTGTNLPVIYNSTNNRFETGTAVIGVPTPTDGQFLGSYDGGVPKYFKVYYSGNSTTTGTATTAVTVTIGVTQANTTYTVGITPRDLLTAVNYYISAQTTTTFTVTFVSALTGSINFDWTVFPSAY